MCKPTMFVDDCHNPDGINHDEYEDDDADDYDDEDDHDDKPTNKANLTAVSLEKSATVSTCSLSGSEAISFRSDLEISLPIPIVKMVTPPSLALWASALVSSGSLDCPSVMKIARLGTLGLSPLAV